MNEELLAKRPWLKQYDWKVPWTMNYPRFPVWELLRNAANGQPHYPATWFYGTTMTYLELYRTCIRMANKLIEFGVKKGDRIGILLPDSPQFNIAYWSTLMTGAIVVNLNPMYTYDELKAIADDTGITGLFTFDMVLPNVKPLCKTVNIPLVIVTRLTDFVNGAGVSTSEELGLEEGWHHLSQLLDQSTNKIPPRVPLEPDDPAIIQFTGGTTGIPKGAVLTQYNTVAAAIQCARWGCAGLDDLPLERRQVLCVLPYFHVYGEVCCVLYCTFTFATQVILPRFDIDEVVNTLMLFPEILYWPCVPTMLQALLNHPRVGELDLPLRTDFVNTGASPCPMELIQQALDMDIYYSEGWGMSETAALGISNPTQGKKKPGSAGIPFPDVDIRLVDPETLQDVPQGERGEIWMKGPTVMKEYWNNPEETAQTLVDGWLRTGDVAYLDEDGYVFIVDRTKDMIIAGGYNIYPRDIDEVLFKHPKVKDVITVGIPDQYRGETLKAFVQLVEGQTATEEELIAFCREHLAAYKVPRLFEFRKELPRTNTGKALRRLLREEEMKKRGSL
jgi:long-chain acyl-CoA synthetase